MAQYINKSALIAEIERRINDWTIRGKNSLIGQGKDTCESRVTELNDLLSFLDTIEVKEVDYERELSKYVSNGIHRFFPNVDDDYCKMDSVIWQDYVIDTAKYFYELGLKAKGE